VDGHGKLCVNGQEASWAPLEEWVVELCWITVLQTDSGAQGLVFFTDSNREKNITSMIVRSWR